MLRGVVLVCTLLVFAASLVLFARGEDSGPVAVWSGIVVLAVLFERWRYNARHDPVDAGWVRTDERFVDPESGETLQVWYDPRSGERRYEKSVD